jgi:hypothetical protein
MDLDVEYRKFPPSVFVVKVYGSSRKSLSDLNKAHAALLDQWLSDCVWSPTGMGLHACECIYHSNPYLIIKFVLL